jgi:hypothetical protein
MWELHPSVIEGAELSPNDFLFMHMGRADHPRNPYVNDLGQYKPELMTGFVTSSGVWNAHSARFLNVDGQEYVVYQLQKSVTSLFGYLKYVTPMHTETVQHVQLSQLEAENVLDGSFPTLSAAVRCSYDLLSRKISPELVGSLMTCRNEELAREVHSGLTADSVARSLEQMQRSVALRWSAVPGACDHAPFELGALYHA